MDPRNETIITEFFLVGFRNLHGFKIPFFILLLVIYTMTATGNLLIILLISTSRLRLSPMYFFLSHLSFCDFLFTTNIVPKMMQVTFFEGGVISYPGCLVQFYMFGSCTAAECYLLSVMSYDRYLAICHPLRYVAIMDRLCLHLVSWSWLLAFVFVLITLLLLCRLDFCNANIIDHFYCDLSPLLILSCSDTSAVEMETLILTNFIVLLPFVFVIVTYICIFITILGISSSMGRQKAFSTCSSHLAVVCSYYGSLISIYSAPSEGQSLTVNKVLSLLYTVVTPLFNPIIYSLRNQEIRKRAEIRLADDRLPAPLLPSGGGMESA
ncbi:olfactory receptor 11A1-like [Spea bombifrons]|uniref:olfactory receptor 11A1-like n=1 Tax=Spea bombifrons TaxID=233779 RepID=UPI00234B1983|nr:olfactory receptor 11A1-like [Spea bombifrons]